MRDFAADPDLLPIRFASTAAFLAWEDKQEIRHEYIDGMVWAMPGGTYRHGLVITNLVSRVHDRLVGGPCRVLSGETRVRAPGGEIMYPDIWIRCGAYDLDAIEIDDPVVAIEVLSPSTRTKDLVHKRRVYQTMPTLRHFGFVEPQRVSVELVSREPGGSWSSRTSTRLDEAVELTAVGASLLLADVYRDVSPA